MTDPKPPTVEELGVQLESVLHRMAVIGQSPAALDALLTEGQQIGDALAARVRELDRSIAEKRGLIRDLTTALENRNAENARLAAHLAEHADSLTCEQCAADALREGREGKG